MTDQPANGTRPRGRPFVKGQPRPPGAGRRRRLFRPGQTEVLEVLARRGLDPLATVADILADPAADPRDRLKAAVALLPYVAEKPPPRRLSLAELRAYVALGRELIAELGGFGTAVAALRVGIATTAMEALAARDPDRARIAVLLTRAVEYLEEHIPPEERPKKPVIPPGMIEAIMEQAYGLRRSEPSSAIVPAERPNGAADVER